MSTDTGKIEARIRTVSDGEVIVEHVDNHGEHEYHAHCHGCDRPVASTGYGWPTRYDRRGAFNYVRGVAARHAKQCAGGAK